MKEIRLTKGQVAIVDDEDYEELSQFKWTASYRKKRECYLAYARINGHNIGMHRYIMQTPKGMDTDHVNHNTLDNRRSNLRICTRSQNNANTRLRSNNKSGYKGVSFHKASGRWRVTLKTPEKQHSLGYFHDKREAALAYNDGAKRHFGEYAFLNEVEA